MPLPVDPREAARLAALSETGLLDALPQKSLDRYTRMASLGLGAPVALVSLVDHRRQYFSSLVGLPEPWSSRRETDLSHSFCKLVVATRKSLVVTDARSDPRVHDNLAVRDLNVIAYAGTPIRTPEQHVLGSFCVIDSKPREWSERELTLLDELGEAVSDEIELRRRAVRVAKSERELADLNRVLADAQEASQLANRQAVHDMRTPLSVINLGVARLLQHEGLSAFPEMTSLLERLHRNSSHAAALLAGFDMREAPPPRSARSNLCSLADEVAHDLSTSRVAVEAKGPVQGLWVPLVESELRRCIENVVSNALRFASEHVQLVIEEREGKASLHIDDDGEGLPGAEEYGRVWLRDVRYHVASGKSGSGLGLSIVKQIVEAVGGSVDAGPSPLGGARFTLSLPSE